MLSGEEWIFCLPCCASIRDLKQVFCDRACVKKSNQKLVSVAGILAAPDTRLIDLVDCPVADLLDPATQKHVLLELLLYAVISSATCSVCEALSARRCGGCHLVRYCSSECQCGDWQRHRQHCKR